MPVIWSFEIVLLGCATCGTNIRVDANLGRFGAHLDGLVQERRNSSALAMELRLSSINPPMWRHCNAAHVICPKKAAYATDVGHRSFKILWPIICCFLQRAIIGKQ